MIAEYLASGLVAAAGIDTTVYEVPQHTRVNIAALELVNTSSSETVEVGVYATQSSRQQQTLIAPARLELLPGNAFEITAAVAIEQNEALVLSCSSANVLSYHLSGVKLAAQPVPTPRGQSGRYSGGQL